jgi:hypothetical protein
MTIEERVHIIHVAFAVGRAMSRENTEYILLTHARRRPVQELSSLGRLGGLLTIEHRESPFFIKYGAARRKCRRAACLDGCNEESKHLRCCSERYLDSSADRRSIGRYSRCCSLLQTRKKKCLLHRDPRLPLSLLPSRGGVLGAPKARAHRGFLVDLGLDCVLGLSMLKALRVKR